MDGISSNLAYLFISIGPILIIKMFGLGSSISARMKKIQLKMKALECSQDFSHYKSMGIFPDAEGQLTPQSLVRSGRISNSSKML